MRAYSAGGVVFRLAPLPLPDEHRAMQSSQGQDTLSAILYSESYTHDIQMEVALVGRKHAGIWTLPKVE